MVAVGSKLAFVMHVYKDAEFADRLLGQIRFHYPDALILCISDGDKSVTPDRFRHHEVQVLCLERLKLQRLGGIYTERWMTLIQDQAERIVKIDPDAQLWRSFNSFPDADISGTVMWQKQHALNLVRGGCVVFKRSAIKTILTSKALRDRCYIKNRNYGYYRYWQWLFPREVENRELIYAEDVTIAHIAKRLKLTLANWDEVNIQWRDEVPENVDLQWAATHPHRG